MKPYVVKVVCVVALLLASAAASLAMKPTKRLSSLVEGQKFETLIPSSFGAWETDKSVAPVSVAPDVQAKLDLYYDQTLSRTYVNRESGEKVMLSIAYGGEQSRTLQVHRPEVCYVAQGFKVSELQKGEIRIGPQAIPVMRLVGKLGPRNEPITYWVRFGRDVVRGNVEQGLSRVRHGLRGEIPDGLLFRVSTIGGDSAHAYRVQEQFSKELLESLPTESRKLLVSAG